jgi:glucose/arabinose dehydrogenase
VGIADGGSGGDPQNLAQNLGNGFGKLFRIDPLGNNSENGNYGIPADNPFAGDNDPNTLGEIWAYGIRNPQRFAWDPDSGILYLTDIGQNTVEKITTVPRGANLGWNVWEGSFRFVNREGVVTANPRSDPDVVYPVAEYDQSDPIIQNQAAATGLVVYRDGPIVALRDKVLWGDSPSGEIFHFDADDPPMGGSGPIRRVLLNDGGTNKTFLQVIQEKNRAQGREPAGRTDIRLNAGPNNRVFLTNKSDGVIRELIP